MKPYLRKFKIIVEFCEEFKKDKIEFAFTDSSGKAIDHAFNEYFCFTPRYTKDLLILHGIVDICDMLGISYLEEKKPDLVERINFLNHPKAIDVKELFEEHVDYIIGIFKNAQVEIFEKLQLLDDEEEHRLNEAINCYMEGCNYSTVAMSVSAIEFRLFSLMMQKCPNPELEELTLGALIREYLDNKQKYGNVIPKKHLPLLEHCNTYRIFSVHPKKEKITRAIATSIINMTFSFLLDKDLKHKQKKLKDKKE
jgi:hypothetical protein